MSSYGNLRRRELRALPTYQYPQQYFYLTEPDVLVQAGLNGDEADHTANHYGDAGSYGFEPATMMTMMTFLKFGVDTKKGLDDADAQRRAAGIAAEAQAITNSQAQAHDQAAALAFQKRLPLIVIGVMATGVLGLVAVIKLTSRK